MDPRDVKKLQKLTDFPALVAYLRDELDWPIEVEDADEVAFDYAPEELGIDPQHAVKIEKIKQIRPLADGQPWGIFYLEFEAKRLPVVVLRRILRALVPKSRGRDPDRPAWRMRDLLFISAQGETGRRRISFAHFRPREDRVDELRTFSWDTDETHLYYIKNLNLEALRWPRDEEDAAGWREQWRRAFTVEHRYVIDTAAALAKEMARQARAVRQLVGETYTLETPEGPLHRLYGSFKEVLLHDLTPDAFADMVAQTVAYGLFSAAAQTDDGPSRGLAYDRMVELIPSTNPFLRDLLAELTSEGGMDLEELGVEQLVDLLNQADMDAILRDFGRQTGAGREDPVVHFYEDFLREYDREQKVQRGVFYTPDPVVSYIVRSVDYLLRTEFGLEDGLADTSVDPETGEPLVQLLDPAVGTATFPAHVIDVIEATVKSRGPEHFGCNDWSEYVAQHLLPRLNGFELMMAPYAVAHMKLGLKLRQTGYDFRNDERLRVYLTNTLEEPVEEHETLGMAAFLSRESYEASSVKLRKAVSVVIGNPPYANFGRMNTGQWISSLISDWRPPKERKWNPDDFMRFMRWVEWHLEKTEECVFAFITNNTYLDGITHRRMRESLKETFTDIYILDLHGSSRKNEITPHGMPDENVFDIQQGVCIALFVKHPEHKGPSKIRFAELWGTREAKYAQLGRLSVANTAWTELAAEPDMFFFVPWNDRFESEFKRGWSVTDLFVLYNSGVQTKKDSLTIHFTRASLKHVLEDMRQRSPEWLRKRYELGEDGRDWTVALAKKDILNSPGQICQVQYRVFDFRWTYFTGTTKGFVGYPRSDVSRELLLPNVAFVTVRQIAGVPDLCEVFVSRHTMTDRSMRSTHGTPYLFPLYTHPSADLTESPKQSSFLALEAKVGSTRQANLSRLFVQEMSAGLDLAFTEEGCGDLNESFGPEDVLHYAYGVFHSPTYRTRYADFLKIDFPRLPLTSDRVLFTNLAALGADLVALHLLEDDYPAASWNQGGRPQGSPLQSPITAFVERATGNTMGAFGKSTCYQNGRVYLDTSQRSRSSYFEGVPEDVWHFHVGGYQVLYKWLYDRRGTRGEPGRTLTEEDIAHYQRIVVALQETMRLMDEIDEVIEAHGGWPIE